MTSDSPDTPEPGSDGGAKTRRSWKRRLLVFGLPGILLAGAIVWGLNYYFNQVPENLGEDYRAEAEPAIEEVDDRMNAVFLSFTRYLDGASVPSSKLKGKNTEEANKVLFPLYDRRDKNLKRADQAIKRARKELRAATGPIEDTPSALFLNEKQPLLTARDAAESYEDYKTRALRFLGSYQEWVVDQRRATQLYRRNQKISAEIAGPDAELDTYLASVDKVTDGLAELDATARRQEPHRDSEALRKLFRQGINDGIVYYEKVREAFDTLDQQLFEDAQDELRKKSRERRGKYGKLIQEVRTESGLAAATRSLAERADDVEDTIIEVTDPEPDSGSGSDPS